MVAITLKLTLEEVELLTALAADQLFRREFIDPRMPGHSADSTEMMLGKTLVERLRKASSRAKKIAVPGRKAVTV